MVFGGRTCEEMGEGNLNDLWSYNPLNNDWTQVEGGGPVPEPRSFHCMTAIGDKLFVFGGCGAKGRLADLHQYDVKERVNHAMCDELQNTHTHKLSLSLSLSLPSFHSVLSRARARSDCLF
jgi:N-acetylneuraminic acid mutarotase